MHREFISFLVWILAAILLPLLAGALLLLRPVENRRTRNGLVMAVSLVTSLLIGGLLLSRPEGTLELGSIHPALTFAFRVDSLSLVFLAILAVLWPIAVLYSFEYMSHEHEENRVFGFFTMTYGVVTAIATAANLFTLYFCYELLTLCTLPLVMHEMDGKARHAGKTYILYSMTGAALAFVAMAAVAHYGSLDFVLGGSLNAAAAAGQENCSGCSSCWAFSALASRPPSGRGTGGCPPPRWPQRRSPPCFTRWRWSTPASSPSCG